MTEITREKALEIAQRYLKEKSRADYTAAKICNWDEIEWAPPHPYTARQIA